MSIYGGGHVAFDSVRRIIGTFSGQSLNAFVSPLSCSQPYIKMQPEKCPIKDIIDKKVNF